MKKRILPILLAVLVLPMLLALRAEAVAGDYTITLTSDIEELQMSDALPVGEQIWIEVWLAGKDASIDTYNAYDMSFSYDNHKLKYLNAVLAEQSAEITVNQNSGTIRIKGCGDEKATARIPVATMCFETVRETGSNETAGVRATSVMVDHSDNAGIQDAPQAEKLVDTAETPIRNYKVVIADGAPIETDFSVVDGTEDVTFKLTDKDTDLIHYEVNVTVAEKDVTDSIIPPGKNETFYTIPHNIIQANRGKIEISVEKVYKEFEVTLRGKDVTGKKKATYNTNYVFRLDRQENYIYTVNVTIDGKAYTDYNVEGNTYTIPGVDIVGDIAIQVHREKDTSNQVKITFAGAGSKDGYGKKKFPRGGEYFFQIRRKEGYLYSVTVYVSGKRVPYSYEGSLDTYYVPAEYVTGDIVVVIGKVPIVEVTEYITMDEKCLFLIAYNGPVEEGEAPKYDGQFMYWSEKYNAYVWLAESAETEKQMKKTAENLIVLKEGEHAGSVDYSGNADRNRHVDLADAKLVWQMYGGSCSLENTSMMRFLAADVYSDKKVNVRDVAVIMDRIRAEGRATTENE